MEENEEQTKVEGTENTGEGDKPEATTIIKQQSERIEELETERDQRIMDDAKKQIHGTAEGGKPATKEKKTKEEAAKAYIKENFENLK